MNEFSSYRTRTILSRKVYPYDTLVSLIDPLPKFSRANVITRDSHRSLDGSGDDSGTRHRSA